MRGNEPPMLLMHGESDFIVGDINIERFAGAIREKDGSVDIIRYPGIGHLRIIGAFSNTFGINTPIVEDAVRFFRSHSESPK